MSNKRHKSTIINKTVAETILNSNLSKYLILLGNKNRIEILKIINKKGPISITEITKDVKLAYKNVHAHIKRLSEAGIIKTTKLEKEHGRKVMVELKDKNALNMV